MAKYSKGAQEKVREEMHEMKKGRLKSGSGKKVTDPKQAVAIALSEAREEGEKVPKKKSATRKSATAKKAAPKKTATKKSASAPKAAPKKAATKKSPTKKAATQKSIPAKKAAPKKRATRKA
ncbi:hypothetical protein GCM10023093_29570 [Nemorincola caseinilytica]|uniref:Histone H1-like protein n=1 Tax=Nemorincola caseinilytica TaxID=2054315 RepID=A0ABP8NML4_9BACT